MDNKILKIEFISMLAINLLSTFFITYTKYINQNDYLNILLSIIFIIPIYLVFKIIFNYQNNLAIDSKIKHLFGIKIGYIMNITIISIIFAILIFNVHMLIYYIKIYYLNKTPLLIIGIAISIPLILLNIKGIKGISRLSFILIFINTLIYLFLLFKLIPFIKINNLKPASINIDTSFKYSILNMMNIFILLIIPKKDIINFKGINKYILTIQLITTIMISLLLFITIGILGIKIFNYLEYPIYSLFKRIYIFTFINRLENIFFLTCINNIFINISLTLYYINKVLNKKNSKLFIYYLTFLAFITPILFFKDNINVLNISYLYILLFILMFIISIIISIKKIMNKSLF